MALAATKTGITTINLPGVSGAAGKNLDPKSERYGQSYTTIPTAGGVIHQYADGQRVTVKSGAPRAASFAPVATPAAPVPGGQVADTTGKAPDYRDSGYFTSAANAQQQRDAAYSSSDAQAAKALAARDTALSQLSAQQPRDEQATTEGENNAGLFYSTHRTQALSDLAAKYAAQRTSAQQAYTDEETQRAADRLGINAGYSSALGNASADAQGRQRQRDQGAADVGALAAPSDTPITQLAAAASSAPAFKTVPGNGGVWHIYPNGRRVFVRK